MRGHGCLPAIQAGVAIWHLELVNYIEHWPDAETPGEGKYEIRAVAPFVECVPPRVELAG